MYADTGRLCGLGAHAHCNHLCIVRYRQNRLSYNAIIAARGMPEFEKHNVIISLVMRK